MFLELMIQLIWLGLYPCSPYLFPGLASFLYLSGTSYLFGNTLDLLVFFPISPYYMIEGLNRGERPKYPAIFLFELARWFLIVLVDDELAMTGYSYGVLLSILLEAVDWDSKWKCYFYLGWTLWIFRSPLSLLLHGLNWIVEFRMLI